MTNLTAAKNETRITRDLVGKKLTVIREFRAPVALVWKSWTESALLDKWWAPRPWRAETKTLDFREGGMWLYAMIGPDGTTAWCRVDFKTIVPGKSFTAENGFCDEDGNINTSFPRMRWFVEFKPTATGSEVDVLIGFDDEADMQKIIDMGFETGFTMGLGNLDELLAQQG